MKALFLDAAGTLFDLAEPVGTVYARIARHHGLKLLPPEAESRFRTAFQDLAPPAYEDFQDGHLCEIAWWRKLVLEVAETTDDENFENFFRELFSYYEQAEAWQLYPDTLPFLEKMRDEFRLAVVSNFDTRLHPILEGLGLSCYFEAIISSAEARSRKPDGEIFRVALQKLGLQPAEVLHIGDSEEADYRGARKAGLSAIHLQRENGETLLDIKRQTLEQ